MATFNSVVFSGNTNGIPVPFQYLDKTHVEVYLDGVLLDPYAFSWPSAGQVALTAGNPEAGVVGTVRRRTPAAPITTFTNGNLDVADLNIASLQPLFIAEEARDEADFIRDIGWVTLNDGAGGSITKGTLGQIAVYDEQGNIVPGPEAGNLDDLVLEAAGIQANIEAAATIVAQQAYDAEVSRLGAIAAEEGAEAAQAATETAIADALAGIPSIAAPVGADRGTKFLTPKADGTGYDGVDPRVSQSIAQGGDNYADNVGLLTVLRATQLAKSRGYYSLKDFATTVIDNGLNNAVPAMQAAVSSGEAIRIPKTADSFRMADDPVFIDNAVKFQGRGLGTRIKRVGDTPGFVLRNNGIHIGDFLEDGALITGASPLFLFGTSVRYVQNTIIENVRSFSGGMLIDDENVKGATTNPVIWDLLVRNVYAFGCRNRGIRLRDGFAFLRFFDVEVGQGAAMGQQSLPCYEFRNFEGLFLDRVEATGLAGYTDLGYTPTTDQRGFIFADGAALHMKSLFADNCRGDGALFTNLQYVDGNDLNASISDGTGFNFTNVDRININTLRSGGRRNMAPGTLNPAGFGVWLSSTCQKVTMGNIVTHNWGNHGFYSQAEDLLVTGLLSADNGGRGYVAEGTTGSSLLVGGQFRDNAGGNYFTGGTSVNHMANLQLANKSFVASVTANGSA